MSFMLMIFKGKNNRKYKIRRFHDGPYQFYEGGKWVYEMRGETALQMMIADVDRKGGKLVYAASQDAEVTTRNEQ